MIRIHELSRRFGEINAVSALSFGVKKGEIFGIVGPDGAGKSTLLRLIAGILLPDGGEIAVAGKSVRENTFEIKERLAYMPQRFGLYEDLTVEENIYFFGALFGVGRREIKKRIVRLYEFSRLGPFKGRLAGQLSGGMKQKLGLACCLVHKPELILLDEPTNGVDPVSRREFWHILYDLLSEGVTIVVSTAYLDEAERCNRVALMHAGGFITIGLPGDIKLGMQKTLLEIIVDDTWRAESLLKKHAEFAGVMREGKALRVFAADARAAEKRIRSLFAHKGLRLGAVREKLPSLENCFMELVAAGGKG